MARFNLQKHLAGWKQVCGQAKDGLHPTDKLKSIINDAGLCTSSNYMSAYYKAGVLINYRDTSGRKGKIRISDKFLTKGNRESMILEYTEIIKRGRRTDNDNKQEIIDQLAQAVDEVRDPVQICVDDNDLIESLSFIENSLCDMTNEQLDLLKSTIDVICRKVKWLVFKNEQASMMIEGLNLIVKSCK